MKYETSTLQNCQSHESQRKTEEHPRLKDTQQTGPCCTGGDTNLDPFQQRTPLGPMVDPERGLTIRWSHGSGQAGLMACSVGERPCLYSNGIWLATYSQNITEKCSLYSICNFYVCFQLLLNF